MDGGWIVRKIMKLTKVQVNRWLNTFRHSRRRLAIVSVILTIALIPLAIFTYRQFTPVKAAPAACPATDGGAGDDDSTVNGVITISSDTTWNAPGPPNNGEVDCTGVDIQVDTGFTLTLNSYDDGDTVYTDDFPYILNTDTLTVDGIVSSDGKGYAGGAPQNSGKGPGPGGGTGGWRTCGGGAGYGGYGGSAGGAGGDPYGSAGNPQLLGSGGGGAVSVGTGGAGGGAIKIVADTLALNGSITANGTKGTSTSCTGGKNRGAGGAGSGGSVYVAVTDISGAGLITANGADYTVANCCSSAEGGGGRIRVSYLGTSTFTGAFFVDSGNGVSSRDTLGTIYADPYCPASDGGYGDDDATLNGVITISSNQTWSALSEPSQGVS